MAKALTSASHGIPSSEIPDTVHVAVGLVTGGEATQLTGGLPIIIDNVLLGGIGVGSGSPEQDLMVNQSCDGRHSDMLETFFTGA